MKDELKEMRRILHQIPELEFDLFKTHDFVVSKLKSMGYEIYVTAKTGIIAVKHGEIKEMIAFRSDMDALPITEKTNVDYASIHDGKMHACGHDGHMAMLLGFANLIKDKTLKKSGIMLIFQPAEEYPGGAKVIIEEGFLKRFNVKKIFGIHLYPELDEGKYGFVKGPMFARNGEFNLTVEGKSAHGAQPNSGIDAILAVSNLINQYHTIVSRSINPLDSAVLTIGTIKGGDARNIIASKVDIKGTVRAFDDLVYEKIKSQIIKMNQGIELSFNVKIEMDFMDFYPVVYNDHDIFDKVIKTFNEHTYELIKPMMLSEDFSFYQNEVPGMFIMLGTRNERLGFVHPLHSSYFNFCESVLTKGVNYYNEIAKAYQLYE